MGFTLQIHRSEETEETRRNGTVRFDSYATGMNRTFAVECKAGFARFFENAPRLAKALADLEEAERQKIHGEGSGPTPAMWNEAQQALIAAGVL